MRRRLLVWSAAWVHVQLMSAQIRQSIESVEALWAANESARVGIAQRWFPAGNEQLEREISKFSDMFKLMLRLHRAHVETPLIRT